MGDKELFKILKSFWKLVNAIGFLLYIMIINIISVGFVLGGYYVMKLSWDDPVYSLGVWRGAVLFGIGILIVNSVVSMTKKL